MGPIVTFSGAKICGNITKMLNLYTLFSENKFNSCSFSVGQL